MVTTVAGMAGMAGMTGSRDDIGTAARFGNPVGVAVDGAGNLYVADFYNSTIRKVETIFRAVTTLAGMAGMTGSDDGKGTSARFNAPSGVAVDDKGYLYVTDYGNHTIRRVETSTGVVTTLAGAAGMSGSVDAIGAAARFNMPARVTVDGAGNLYIADWGNFTIRQIALAKAAVTTTFMGVAGQRGVKLGALPGGLNKPAGIAVSPTGGFFIIDLSENAVLTVR